VQNILEESMKLKPIQLSILIIQITALFLNLYAILIKKVEDVSAHLIGICLVLIMMLLSIKSWIDCNKKTQKR
jgi:chromatin segregation and condensation protein Rec8/ScpA/Scc1 (kleisin family)